MLGTDFPYESGDLFRRAISYIPDGLGEDDGAAVLDGNAAALLGLG